MTDRLLARLELPDPGHAAVAGAAVTAAAQVAGLPAERCQLLGATTTRACAVLERTAYGTGQSGPLAVSVRRLGHDLHIEIDDEGLPFHQASVQALLDGAVEQALRDGTLEEFDHRSEGRQGNRSVLVANLDPGPDIRESPPDELETPSGVTVDPEDLELRIATADDAEGLARLTWRTYGYSYQRDEYYHPTELRDLLESEDVRGWVLVAPDGEIVGHLAAALAWPGALVAEGGRGMVDPRYRGRGLMRRMGTTMWEWTTERAVIGLYGHAVTAHTRTQHDDRTIGGILLGYLPPVVEFKDIATEVTGRRQAVAMTYSPLADQPHRVVHAPAADREILAAVYAGMGLERTFAESDGSSASASTSTSSAGAGAGEPQVEMTLRSDLGTARFVVHDTDARSMEVVRSQLPSVLATGVRVVYLAMPLSDPDTPAVAEQAEALGFHFGGVRPYGAPDGGDSLIYQRTGDLPIVRDDIQLANEFSDRVLDHVLTRRRAATGI